MIARSVCCTVADLLTNKDATAVLEVATREQPTNAPVHFKLNELCAVVKQASDTGYDWYIILSKK